MRHVGHGDRSTVHGFQWHLTDLFQTLLTMIQPTRTPDHQLLLAPVHIPAADVGVVALQCHHDVVLGQLVGQQSGRVQVNLVLTHLTAKGEHIGHALGRDQ